MDDKKSNVPITVHDPIPFVSTNITPIVQEHNTLEDLKKLPLPWKKKYINNQLILSLDTNEYYSIDVPTGFYCVLDKDEVNDDSKKAIKSLQFTWKKNKVPMDFLYRFVKTSAKVYEKYKSEFAACIFHNTKTDEYDLLVPFQTISGSSVTYSPSDGFDVYNDIEDMNCVVDLHSHHTMTIGFSSTDNHSDDIIGALGSISLVIKGINAFNFIDPDKSVDIRLTIQGKHYPLKLKDIFDMSDELFEFADKDFIKKEKPVSDVVLTPLSKPITVNSSEKEYSFSNKTDSFNKFDFLPNSVFDDDPFEDSFGLPVGW